MSTFTSAGGQQSLTISGATTPTTVNVSMPLAATEYSYTLPAGCKQFIVKLRQLSSLKVAYVSGQSGTTYLEVPRGCFYAESGLTLSTGVTLYFQSPAAGQVLEVQVWT
jgi:hypothetical protein